ncbi:MAG: HupE/UreJ family protein [Janthinobacterium lividum]
MMRDSYQSGCLRVRLPRRTESGRASAIVLNTADGLADGDSIEQDLHWAEGACATVTTLAAEKSIGPCPPAAASRLASDLTYRRGAALGMAMLFWAAPALAHPGHDGAQSSFFSGVLHPLTGMDHLAAMLMVGLWAGLTLGRKAWAAPAAFVGFMLAGFALGAGGVALPMTEGLVAASLVVLGLALAFAVRAPLGVTVPLVGLFALAHGNAHGAELPHGAVAWQFAAGFALTTTLLHMAGVAGARLTGSFAGRAVGALGAAGGMFLFLGS